MVTHVRNGRMHGRRQNYIPLCRGIVKVAGPVYFKDICLLCRGGSS